MFKMKVCVFIILMVIQAITSEKAVSKLRRKLIVPNMNEKCKKIKCAAVDEPFCVRMRRHDLSLTIHIIAANKCELEYMKCHDDVEAKIVLMKYCSHNVGETDEEKKNKPGKAHIRVKRRVKTYINKHHIQRQAEPVISTTAQPRIGFKDNNNKTKHPKLKKLRINSKKISKWKNEDSNVIPKGNDSRSAMKGYAAGRQNSQAVVGYPFSSETDSDFERNEGKKISKGIAGHRLDVEDEDADSPTQHLQLQPKALIAPSPIGMEENNLHYQSENQEEELNFWGREELGPEFPILSKEAVKFSKESLTEADKNEYEAMCPLVCPSRNVMVCGKCQHGVYKTFLSVCHLRMFTCQHEEEILQLVSRYPCVLSAPYISDAYEKPKAVIQEAGDEDKILRFIKCRNEGKLGTDEKPPALSIIFTNQVEARTFNKTHELKKNEEYDIISKSAYKHSDRANEIGKNDTELMNKIYTHFDLRSDTNAESRHDILSRYKYNQAMAQTIAMEKVKQEGATKLESNYESSLQNYVEKENQPTVTPVQRQKHLTLRHRNTKIRSTQEVREEQLIPKITHKRNAEVETEICKTKHCDYKNHRSFEKRSREHNDYKLKRRDEFKTETKHNNKRKVNKNNMKVEHRFIKSHRTFNPQENSVYEIEQRDIKKPVSNMISMENDIYVQKHIHDFRISLEQPVSKQVYPEYKPKFSQNFQKKRERDKKVRKVRDIDNAKHDKEKVISNREKYKPTLNENRESVSETHTAIRKGENKINANSADILNPDDADSQTLENQDEKEILDSCDDLSKENNHLNKPRLIFYVSSTTKRVKEIFTKLPKKLVSQKDEGETDKLLGDLNSVLGGNSDLKNIDLNTKINRLASSKILDFITDRVAVQMLKKLENILEFKNPMGRTEGDPEKVEQIDILFKNDGDMVMKGREHIKEKEEDENGTREAFYSK